MGKHGNGKVSYGTRNGMGNANDIIEMGGNWYDKSVSCTSLLNIRHCVNHFL